MTIKNSPQCKASAGSLRTLGKGRQRKPGRCERSWLLWSITALLAFAPLTVQASIFKGEALDKAADVLAIVILIFVPIGVITVFWLVHILPEKIAEKRHHPQQTAIKTLCLLSLVFGGMLWPIAWLWAYTKPIGHKMAYGTDKHESYFMEACEKAEEGKLPPAELATVREELDELAARGLLTPELRAARDRLATLPTPPKQQTAQQPPAPQQQPAQPGQPGGAV
jgi:CBS domain containing-hemolysin-like protein